MKLFNISLILSIALLTAPLGVSRVDAADTVQSSGIQLINSINDTFMKSDLVKCLNPLL